MKTKELKNLKEKEVGELEKQVSELKKKVVLIYMNIRIGKEKNLKVVKNLRRDLAQVLTILSQKKGETKE